MVRSTSKPMPESIERPGLQRATLQSPAAAAGKAAQEALCRRLHEADTRFAFKLVQLGSGSGSS